MALAQTVTPNCAMPFFIDDRISATNAAKFITYRHDGLWTLFYIGLHFIIFIVDMYICMYLHMFRETSRCVYLCAPVCVCACRFTFAFVVWLFVNMFFPKKKNTKNYIYIYRENIWWMQTNPKILVWTISPRKTPSGLELPAPSPEALSEVKWHHHMDAAPQDVAESWWWTHFNRIYTNEFNSM